MKPAAIKSCAESGLRSDFQAFGGPVRLPVAGAVDWTRGDCFMWDLDATLIPVARGFPDTYIEYLKDRLLDRIEREGALDRFGGSRQGARNRLQELIRATTDPTSCSGFYHVLWQEYGLDASVERQQSYNDVFRYLEREGRFQACARSLWAIRTFAGAGKHVVVSHSERAWIESALPVYGVNKIMDFVALFGLSDLGLVEKHTGDRPYLMARQAFEKARGSPIGMNRMVFFDDAMGNIRYAASRFGGEGLQTVWVNGQVRPDNQALALSRADMLVPHIALAALHYMTRSRSGRPGIDARIGNRPAAVPA